MLKLFVKLMVLLLVLALAGPFFIGARMANR